MLEATNCSQHPHLCTQRPKHKAFLLSGDRGELLYRLHWLQYNCITAHVPSWAQRPAACAHVCLFDFSFLYNMPPSECLAGIVFHPTNCLRSFTKAALLIVLSGSFHTLVFKPPPSRKSYYVPETCHLYQVAFNIYSKKQPKHYHYAYKLISDGNVVLTAGYWRK